MYTYTIHVRTTHPLHPSWLVWYCNVIAVYKDKTKMRWMTRHRTIILVNAIIYFKCIIATTINAMVYCNYHTVFSIRYQRVCSQFITYEMIMEVILKPSSMYCNTVARHIILCTNFSAKKSCLLHQHQTELWLVAAVADAELYCICIKKTC